MKKYVLVGASGRSFGMFAKPIVEQFSDVAELLGIYDPNQSRAKYFRDNAAPKAQIFDDFDKMLDETKPDAVIVATVDRYHHEYIIKALEKGCDAISEKPLTIDEDKCNAIIEAEKRTGKKVLVTFNCRFMPIVKRIKELINEGLLGDILNVDFEYLLDTSHGADYFRRWHRNMENSGGLLVHKSTHHFDMVNWWIGQSPETIHANGTRRFYGPTRQNRGERCSTCKFTKKCEFAFGSYNDEFLKGMYFNAEKEDGYYRDKCVFSDEIDIYDSMSVAVKYDKGALLTYSLVAYSPYEGWKIAFTGTNGRMETATYYSGENASMNCDVVKYYNRKGEVITYNIPQTRGTHGGGDVRLLEMLIRGNMEDPLRQLAGSVEGVKSAMIGICANKSIKDGKAYTINDLIQW